MLSKCKIERSQVKFFSIDDFFLKFIINILIYLLYFLFFLNIFFFSVNNLL